MRLKLDRLATALEDLAAKGPLKPEGLRGLNEEGYEDYLKGEDITVTDGLKMMPPKVGVRFVKDDSHYRTGWLLSEDMTQKMLEQATKMKKLVHKDRVAAKEKMELPPMQEEVDVTRGLMMMAYPGFHGLGDWEPVWVLLENKEEFDANLHNSDDLKVDDTVLWCVNKELQLGKVFSDYFGKNEKSKMVIKVTKRGGGAPQREPLISENEHKKMLAYYHKKQEEAKNLDDADDGDQYLNSAWADNKQLKQQLQGMKTDIRMKF